jgi:hypothetical protein
MMDNLGEFTGDKSMKMYVKSLSFWPTQYKEHFGTSKVIPKSEADLTREESTMVMEHLELLGTMLPGFEFDES